MICGFFVGYLWVIFKGKAGGGSEPIGQVNPSSGGSCMLHEKSQVEPAGENSDPFALGYVTVDVGHEEGRPNNS